MPTPFTVVFDLDGTLADTAPDIMATLNHLLAGEGLPALPVARARDLVGAGARALLERGFAAAGEPLSPERLDGLFARFLEHYLEHVAGGTTLFPGVEAALAELAEEGCLLAVCTNKPEPHSVKLLGELALSDRFAFIAGRETFPFCKPDPRHLTETIRRAGGDPSRGLLVGDSRTDLDTARRAGLPIIGVPFGYSDVPMAELGPDRMISGFDALAEAVRALARDLAKT